MEKNSPGLGLPQRTAEGLLQLSEWLGRREPGWSLPQLQGFLFSVLTAPVMIGPSEWIACLRIESDGFESEEEASVIVPLLLAEYQHVAELITPEEVRLPEESGFAAGLMSNFEPPAGINGWCTGFLVGHLWLDALWEPLIAEDPYLGECVGILGFFASTQMLDSILEADKDAKADVIVKDIQGWFAAVMGDFADAGRVAFLESSMGPEPASSKKVGRNQPCPCGSGKKYKKCCGGPRPS